MAWSAGGALLLTVILCIPGDTSPSPMDLGTPMSRLLAGTVPGSDQEAAAGLVGGLQRRAMAEAGRQGRRPPLLRNYAEARDLLAAAAEEADRLLAAADAALRADRMAAEGRLLAARAALQETRAAGQRARLQRDGRRTLKRQELMLEEAERNLQRGAYAVAMAKADEVTSDSVQLRDRARRTLARLADADSLSTWQRWVKETVAWSRQRGAAALVVDKASRQLFLYESGRLMATFQVDLGTNPVPDKLHEGDNATPEGRYRVTEVRAPGQTRYHRALMLDYPNNEDWARFRAAHREGRLSPGARIGGLIEIHGHGGRGEDWTNGCVALSDREMDFLVGWIDEGTPVTIVGALKAPRDMADAGLGGAPGSR